MSAARLGAKQKAESNSENGRTPEAGFDVDRIHGPMTVDIAQLAHVIRRLLDSEPETVSRTARPHQAIPELHFM